MPCTSRRGPSCGVTLVNDVLPQTVTSGLLVTVSAADGSELLRLDLGHDTASAPSVHDDMVYVGTGLTYLAGPTRPGASLRALRRPHVLRIYMHCSHRL